jgi:hypothetical protein
MVGSGFLISNSQLAPDAGKVLGFAEVDEAADDKSSRPSLS